MSTSRDDALLELIPKSQLKRYQIAKLRKNVTWPTYRLRREPNHLDEIERYGHGIAIWRDNGTLTYLSPRYVNPDLNASKKHLRFDLSSSINCTVVGKTNKTIAETVTYLWNVKYSKSDYYLKIGSPNSWFDFNVIDAEQLAKFVQRTSTGIEIHGISLSAAQSVALATRPEPRNLILSYPFRFEDEGKAFINALQRRQSSFGQLILKNDQNNHVCFEDDTLQELFQIKTIKRIYVRGALEDDVIPFVFDSPIKCIQWEQTRYKGNQVVYVEQGTVQLYLKYCGAYPTESIFSSLFQLGHFGITNIRLCIYNKGQPVPDLVLQQMFRWIAENQNLETLEWYIKLESIELAKSLLSVLEGHTGLRFLTMDRYPHHLDPNYAWLMQLLMRNRRIELLHDEYCDCDDSEVESLHYDDSDDSESFDSEEEESFDDFKVEVAYPEDMEKLLRFNRVYRGSALLGQESPPVRLSLVSTILMQSAPGSFQRSALLLAEHTDALCELIQDHVALLDSLAAAFTFPMQTTRTKGRSNRKNKARRAATRK